MSGFRLLIAGWLAFSWSALCWAEVKLIGTATISGEAVDLSGLTGAFADGTPVNRLGGLGSAIAYTGQGNLYVLASDRGPLDGATDYPCRLHLLEIIPQPGQQPPLMVQLKATVLLRDENGQALVGSLAAFDAAHPERTLRFDPEGIRVGPRGTYFVSDEYGPYLYEFNAQGKRLRTLPIPKRFQPARPSSRPEEELPPHNLVGRQPNRGLEGLAITPDGRKLLAALQSPLIQDGALDAAHKRVGINLRLIELDLADGKTRELVYPLENPSLGISEILAVNDHEFLVLERDGKAGPAAQFKKLFRIDIREASDVSSVERLPSTTLPNGVKPVRKELFLDLLDPKFGLAGPQTPEKHEGLAFGPDLPDGRRLLLVTVDNDFVASVPTTIHAFAVDRSDLPNFEPQQVLRPSVRP